MSIAAGLGLLKADLAFNHNTHDAVKAKSKITNNIPKAIINLDGDKHNKSPVSSTLLELKWECWL